MGIGQSARNEEGTDAAMTRPLGKNTLWGLKEWLDRRKKQFVDLQEGMDYWHGVWCDLMLLWGQ
jgi:hypothetical protein